jgi:hypothetical protein
MITQKFFIHCGTILTIIFFVSETIFGSPIVSLPGDLTVIPVKSAFDIDSEESDIPTTELGPVTDIKTTLQSENRPNFWPVQVVDSVLGLDSDHEDGSTTKKPVPVPVPKNGSSSEDILNLYPLLVAEDIFLGGEDKETPTTKVLPTSDIGDSKTVDDLNLIPVRAVEDILFGGEASNESPSSKTQTEYNSQSSEHSKGNVNFLPVNAVLSVLGINSEETETNEPYENGHVLAVESLLSIGSEENTESVLNLDIASGEIDYTTDKTLKRNNLNLLNDKAQETEDSYENQLFGEKTNWYDVRGIKNYGREHLQPRKRVA